LPRAGGAGEPPSEEDAPLREENADQTERLRTFPATAPEGTGDVLGSRQPEQAQGQIPQWEI